tara:strand:- start:146 stop:1087 length:942 start_codon:yes stop_codon:yes gene_type:complete
MRQAGRYLPEFREIRSKNTNFVELCLNPKISKEITLQPLRRFPFDAAIIFSDILLIPYALGQNLEFKKDFGPLLGDLNIEKILNLSDDEICAKLNPVYELIKSTSEDKVLINKDLIGFVGATWTLLVYMLNKKSPKKKLDTNIYKNSDLDKILNKIINTQKLHIKKQVENGASIIQIFDSWAGLLETNKFDKYIYQPTKELVDFVKSLGVEAICFPRGIKSYKEYCDIVKPSAISIDYEVNPNKIAEDIDIPIQGGLDPKCLLLDKKDMLKSAQKYLEIFKNHQYIFNLGHGVIPETKPENVKMLVDFVKDFR